MPYPTSRSFEQFVKYRDTINLRDKFLVAIKGNTLPGMLPTNIQFLSNYGGNAIVCTPEYSKDIAGPKNVVKSILM